MFARASANFGTRAFSAARGQCIPKPRRAAHWAIASSALAGFSLYVVSQKPVYNDAPAVENLPHPTKHHEDIGLSPLVWGSNQWARNRLIAPGRDSKDCIKSPTYAPELFSSPLRDLAICSRHAACIDAAGNVYQWGDGFFDSNPGESRQPRLTLHGKNIISLAVTPYRIYALSTAGKIYVLSSSIEGQIAPPAPRSLWNIFSSSKAQPAFDILNTDVSLLSGEKFTSISAGSDHLLALTSHGRTFAHPVTRLANRYGQLGVRKISIPDFNDTSKRVPIELAPKTIRDSHGNANIRPPAPNINLLPENHPPIDNTGEISCDRLFEVSALRGVDVQQAVAGDRTSFVVTRREGRVLGWGANEYGQLGLGPSVTLPNVTVPAEIVLNRFTERGTSTRCVDVVAGGDLTLFTVERDFLATTSRVVDVLACGNGQWGGLGNGSYSNAQGTPVKVKNISGILEYDEETQSLKPLRPHHISIAPGPVVDGTSMVPASSGHVIATLDTIPLSHPSPLTSAAAHAADTPGRDILAWGLNQHYQLGNGKRASMNIPAPIPTGDGEGRLMCRIGREKVTDMSGKLVGRRMEIEQRAVACPGVSIVYWRIV